jgi:hypothetical protein
MTINYTTLLALGQPVTGTEAGNWGDDVNNAITSYLDAAVAGTQTITADAAITLSLTQGTNTATNLAQVGAGTTGSAQYAVILCSGARTAARNIVVPSSSRQYVVINSTTGGFGVFIKGTATTGITVAANETALVVWNGSDFIKATSTTYTGSVTSVAQSFTGGLISVAGSPITSSGTLALTVAGTSGGVPYFSSGSTWASSAALAANSLVIGGGAGVAPASTTTGTGVVTALGVNTGTAGAFVVNGGALGTPSSGTLTSATGLPISTGVSGLGTGVATALAVNVGSAGAPVVNGGALGTPSSGTLTSATGLPLSTGVTGNLPVANLGSGTGASASTFWRGDGSWAAAGGSAATPTVAGSVFGSMTAAGGTPFLTATGYNAGPVNTGVNNTFNGLSAGLINTTGTNNTFVGYQAGKANISGSNNVIAGSGAGAVMTSGNNVMLGYNAGLLNTSGNSNVYIGYRAGSSMAGGSSNVMIGLDAGLSTTGQNNNFVGANAGNQVTTATFNTIVGSFNGNQNGIDARTVTKNVILSNGNGDVVARWQAGLMGQLYAGLGESMNVNTGAATGTITFYASSYSILYYTGSATANQTLNIIADGAVTLTSQQISSAATILGSAITVAYMVTNGATAYRPSVIQIDGTAYTPKWQGGTAPTAGNANAVDVYIFTCVYQSYLSWQIFASQTKFA